jgi:hydrogenase maturation protease
MPNDHAGVLVIGVGNEWRSDDGIGIHVVRRLKEWNEEQGGTMRIPSHEELTLRENHDGISLNDTWQGSQQVIIVDAMCSGQKPGTIRRFDVQQEAIPRGIFPQTLHHYGPAEAIELARALNELPAQLILYGIEGANFAQGKELSPEIERVIETVVNAIIGEIERMSLG